MKEDARGRSAQVFNNNAEIVCTVKMYITGTKNASIFGVCIKNR